MFWGISTDGDGSTIELLNFWLAQTGFLLIFVLSARFIMQRIPKRFKRKPTKKTYLFFKTVHIVLGFVLILVGLFHGLLSAKDASSFLLSWGFVCWILSIMAALTYYFRKIFKKPRFWLVLHRILTVAIIITVIVHIAVETA